MASGKTNSAVVAIIGIDRLYSDLKAGGYHYNFALASIGYRKMINSLFIEPKAGAGINVETSYSGFAAYAGIEPGFQTRRFTFSVDYRLFTVDGFAFGDHFHTFSLKVGYRFKHKRP